MSVNAGWSVGGDAYDHGAIIVLAGVMTRHGASESGVQGEGWQVSKRSKEKMREMRERFSQELSLAGKRCALKGACTVWGGTVGKGPVMGPR